MKRIIAIAALTLIAACATPLAYEQTVFQMRGAQNAALRAAVEYRELTQCAAVKVQPCADKAVVTQLQLADRVADTALAAAEGAVRTPGFGESVMASAVAAAEAGLAAFQSILATVKGK